MNIKKFKFKLLQIEIISQCEKDTDKLHILNLKATQKININMNSTGQTQSARKAYFSVRWGQVALIINIVNTQIQSYFNKKEKN